MNLASETVDPSCGVFFVNFNQDCTTLSVGTNSGYKLFPLSSVDKLEPVYQSSADENICIVERLFASSLLALVSLSAPRKLKVCHFKKKTEICNYSYSNTILAVKLNRKRLVICLEESLYIHNIKDMKVIHTIKDTPPNPRGLCALSSSNDNCFLAYPGSSSVGEVQIFDAYNLQAKLMIPAHDNPLAALAFNSSATKIATASEKGTVIRVFNTLDGQKLYEFRRGVKRCVTIYSLSFSADSKFLCASSNTETVHIFKLEDMSEANINPAEEPQGWMGYFGKALMQSASYLPSQVTEMFTQGRSFATVHLPFSGLKNVCAIAEIENILRVLVASADGYLYIYNLDKVEGGDCTLIKQHKLDGSGESTGLSDQSGDKSAASGVTGTGGPLSNASHGSAARRVDRTGHSGNSSYAAVVRGCDAVSSSDSPLELLRGSLDGVHDDSGNFSPESSPRPIPRLDDETEFPPMSQKSE